MDTGRFFSLEEASSGTPLFPSNCQFGVRLDLAPSPQTVLCRTHWPRGLPCFAHNQFCGAYSEYFRNTERLLSRILPYAHVPPNRSPPQALKHLPPLPEPLLGVQPAIQVSPVVAVGLVIPFWP